MASRHPVLSAIGDRLTSDDQETESACGTVMLAITTYATLVPIQFRTGPTKTEPLGIVVVEHVGAFALLALLFPFA